MRPSPQPSGSAIAPKSGYYVVDPFGDLGSAGTGLKKLVRTWSTTPSQRGAWSGHVGKPIPESDEIFGMLGSRDVFLYMGHGEGAKQLLKHEQVQAGASALPGPGGPPAQKCPLRSIIVLMGCSSAKVFSPVGPNLSACDRGCMEYEFFGMPCNVLIGGGPAVVGAMWDVLGGDLDAFTCAFLERWVGGGAPGTSCRQAAGGGGCGHEGGGSAGTMMEALVSARGSCHLPYLTGTSVVCYGVPL